MKNETARREIESLDYYLQNHTDDYSEESHTAMMMAIKALEQQPTDAKTYLKRREENYIEYNVEWFLKNWELELEILSGGKIKPADAVSRSELMNLYKEWQPRLATNVCEFEQALEDLPPATPERPKGKWIEDTQTGFKIRCSKCGARNFGADRAYCPRCGRQMKEDNDD